MLVARDRMPGAGRRGPGPPECVELAAACTSLLAREHRNRRPRLCRPAARRRVRGGRAGRRRRRRRPREGRRAAPRALPHRGRPGERLQAVRERIRFSHALSRRCTTADAILLCVPTPLTRNREPDLGPLLSRGAGARRRPARATSSSCSSPRPSPARRASSSCRCSRSPACTPATTSTSRSRPSASIPAAPTTRCARRRRSSAGSRRAAPSAPTRSTRCVCDEIVPRLHARGRRAVEAAGEHLPLGQHRARQRAVDPRRPHGHRHLGGHRRGRRPSPTASCASIPGPGMGGHCLPVDPFYLTWKAREYDLATEFIELAGKVNEQMPASASSGSSGRSTTCASPSTARASCCSACPTRPASATCASRPR